MKIISTFLLLSFLVSSASYGFELKNTVLACKVGQAVSVQIGGPIQKKDFEDFAVSIHFPEPSKLVSKHFGMGKNVDGPIKIAIHDGSYTIDFATEINQMSYYKSSSNDYAFSFHASLLDMTFRMNGNAFLATKDYLDRLTIVSGDCFR